MLRVKGSTIIEALVAMTITVTVFGATLSLFMNVGRDMNQPLKAKAEILVGNEITELKSSGIFQTGIYSSGNIEIEKSVQKHEHEEDLNMISITAKRRDNGKLLLRRRLWQLNNELVVKTKTLDEQ